MRPVFLLLFVAAAIANPELAGAQSFNCAKAFYADEKRICREPGLSQLDEQLAKLYAEVSRRLGERGLQLEKEEDDWVRKRRNCGPNYRCIERKYQTRMAELGKHLEDTSGKESDGSVAATGSSSQVSMTTRDQAAAPVLHDAAAKQATRPDRKPAAGKSPQSEPRAASTENSGGSRPTIQWVNPPPAGGAAAAR